MTDIKKDFRRSRDGRRECSISVRKAREGGKTGGLQMPSGGGGGRSGVPNRPLRGGLKKNKFSGTEKGKKKRATD